MNTANSVICCTDVLKTFFEVQKVTSDDGVGTGGGTGDGVWEESDSEAVEMELESSIYHNRKAIKL